MSVPHLGNSQNETKWRDGKSVPIGIPETTKHQTTFLRASSILESIEAEKATN